MCSRTLHSFQLGVAMHESAFVNMSLCAIHFSEQIFCNVQWWYTKEMLLSKFIDPSDRHWDTTPFPPTVPSVSPGLLVRGRSREGSPGRARITGDSWWSSGQGSALPLQEAWVPSLVWEIRSPMPHRATKVKLRKRDSWQGPFTNELITRKLMLLCLNHRHGHTSACADLHVSSGKVLLVLLKWGS